MAPSISVILSTHNRSKVLGETLAKFAELEVHGLGVEFVVVDNNSNDSTADIIESFTNKIPVCHLFEARPGKNYALNKMANWNLIRK